MQRLVSLVAVLGVMGLLGSTTLGPTTNVNEDTEAFWVERIQSQGSVNAYTELIVFTRDKNPGIQHNTAHAFGGALYLTHSPLSTCDERFANGCFHEYVGRSLAEQGFNAKQDLLSLCTEAMNGTSEYCYHSLGHGILAYLGYERVDLTDALAICEDSKADEEYVFCYSGVFMEYNLRTMLAADAESRSLTAEHWQEPCDSLTGLRQNFCVFWLPTWWNSIENEETMLARFDSMAKRCDEFTGDLRRICYGGLGKTSLVTGGVDSANTCKNLSHDSETLAWCTAGLAQFSKKFRTEQNLADAKLMCKTLSERGQHYCNYYVTTNSPIALPAPSNLTL